MLKLNLEKLKKIRKEHMSLSEMAAKLGYRSLNGYYYLESGRNRMPAETLAQISEILKVPIQDFFEETDSGKKETK